MIQLPRRSVTRFFIPLIDVLTLLFCIFLLMPLVKPPTEAGLPPGSTTGPDALDSFEPARRTDDLLTDTDRAREQAAIQAAQEELHRLRSEKIETLQQRLAIRVLDIDADTGKLYYHEPEQRVEIASQAEARRLIDRQRQDAPGRELYYLFLFPRQLTGYPQEKQIKQYQRWFEGVAHGFDNPRAAR